MIPAPGLPLPRSARQRLIQDHHIEEILDNWPEVIALYRLTQPAVAPKHPR